MRRCYLPEDHQFLLKLIIWIKMNQNNCLVHLQQFSINLKNILRKYHNNINLSKSKILIRYLECGRVVKMRWLEMLEMYLDIVKLQSKKKIWWRIYPLISIQREYVPAVRMKKKSSLKDKQIGQKMSKERQIVSFN